MARRPQGASFLRGLLAAEGFSAALLLGALVIALIFATISPEGYHSAVETDLVPGDRSLTIQHLFSQWLMAIFFVVVGLELGRELTTGDLRGRAALLPVAAALGGMLVPALIVLAVAAGQDDAQRLWAVPTATDALAIAFVRALGKRVPRRLVVIVIAIAVIADVLAVLAVAVCCGKAPSPVPTAAAAVVLVAAAVLSRRSSSHARVPVACVVMLCTAVVAVAVIGGIHASLVGTAIGFAIPTTGRGGQRSMGERWEEVLHPVSAYLVVPGFALVAAGVPLRGGILGTALTSRGGVGVILGLVVGKPVGVLLGARLAVLTGRTTLPRGVTWRSFTGIAALCGIGFTVAALVAELAVHDVKEREPIIAAVLIGSTLSALIGWWLLWRTPPPQTAGAVSARGRSPRRAAGTRGSRGKS